MLALDHAKNMICCNHGAPVSVGGPAQWCPHCGAVRYRSAGETSMLPWQRTLGVAAVDAALQSSALSPLAQRCLDEVQTPGAYLSYCAAAYGIGAVLELVFRDLVDVDEKGLVAPKEARPSDVFLVGEKRAT